MTPTVEPAFTWPVRVYYEDTDAAGIVYHAAYLKFFERARTEWLRHLGFSQARLRSELGLLFALASAEVRWLRPARLDDNLLISASVRSCGKVSIEFDQRAFRADTGLMLAEATTRVGCLDAERMKPRRLPADILSEIVHDG